MKKVIITRDNEANCTVWSELEKQELYEAYVAMTAYMARKINNTEDIKYMANQAALDALNIINNKKTQN